MKELEKYNPFNIREYYIISDGNKNFFKYKGYLLELSKEGYIPKSGLLFDEVLDFDTCNNKNILDLGCGYLGILGIIAKFNGAKNIDSIDYDDNCVLWFNKIIKENGYNNIKCFKSNYFENIKDNYDLILSNPPQLPMKNGSLHDSGGIDGRKYILEIMNQSFLHLKDNGKLYLLVFDFLGSLEKTNKEKSLLEIANDIGYKKVEMLYEIEKTIKEGSLTYENLSYISKIYPFYDFKNNKCKIQILSMEK